MRQRFRTHHVTSHFSLVRPVICRNKYPQQVVRIAPFRSFQPHFHMKTSLSVSYQMKAWHFVQFHSPTPVCFLPSFRPLDYAPFLDFGVDRFGVAPFPAWSVSHETDGRRHPLRTNANHEVHHPWVRRILKISDQMVDFVSDSCYVVIFPPSPLWALHSLSSLRALKLKSSAVTSPLLVL